jgi:hypothetical protein
MFKKVFVAMFVSIFLFGSVAFAQQRTVVNSSYASRKLLGRHFLSLQWISTDYLGRAYVKRRKGVYYLTGSQNGRGNTDSLKIDGVITEISRYNFKFNGKITTEISHIAGGRECVREGEMTFAITKRRKYWRLQEMKNPCDTATDYVDIYFRR